MARDLLTIASGSPTYQSKAMESPARILVVDEEASVSRTCLTALVAEGYEVARMSPGAEALQAIESQHFDVAMLGLAMPGFGLRLLRALRRLSPQTEVIVISDSPSLEKAKESIRLGALEFVTKPFGPEALRRLIAQALACKPWKMQER
jgi:DNA-binding NtrC family response regulator